MVTLFLDRGTARAICFSNLEIEIREKLALSPQWRKRGPPPSEDPQLARHDADKRIDFPGPEPK